MKGFLFVFGGSPAPLTWGMRPPLADFGSDVYLIGAVARQPEFRGTQLAFVVAGEERVRMPSGEFREMAFYQRCLLDRQHPAAKAVLYGQALALEGTLLATKNQFNNHMKVVVVASDLRLLERPASDLIRDAGGGYRLKRGYQQVIISGRASDNAVPIANDNGPMLTFSLAVPGGAGTQINWIEVKSFMTNHLEMMVHRGQRVVARGRLWNRDKYIGNGRRHTFSVIDAGEIGQG
ncbi:hypothetical protein Dxin01_00755 [Deinococcus xinjiangensis]|uniref:Uncharacterized protein n=1 Tax=Deinococcus xinjiangensis TaxID=457454 RepID=A0ABP9V6Y7_9DEIO